ncbi:PEP-CTERM sorting domain-containing protein [Kiritimatiellota bacterium B12222]|nr:PEP-CTERM sorting domain-containing protein [Kiritimatiellota bacterium B12222]
MKTTTKNKPKIHHLTLRGLSLLPILAAWTSAQASTLAWYRMEGTAGDVISSVANSSGTAAGATASDTTIQYGSSVAGSHIYDPVSGTTVANTSSMAFNGTTTDAFLTVTDGSTSGPFDVADFTVEMFVKIDTVLTNNRPFVSHGGGIDSGWNVRSVEFSSDQYASGTISGANVFNSNKPVIDDGEWHHLAFVVQTSTSGSEYARLYMDGDLVREKTTGLDTYVPNVSADFLIYGGDYVGFSDEVRFSNTALDSSDFLVAIPEPGTLTLFGVGIAAAILAARRNSKQNNS